MTDKQKAIAHTTMCCVVKISNKTQQRSQHCNYHNYYSNNHRTLWRRRLLSSTADCSRRSVLTMWAEWLWLMLDTEYRLCISAVMRCTLHTWKQCIILHGTSPMPYSLRSGHLMMIETQVNMTAAVFRKGCAVQTMHLGCYPVTPQMT